MNEPILDVRDLAVRFRHPVKRRSYVHAVDGVSLELRRGEVLGVVGESGSGKSTIGRCILGLERPTAGSIRFEDEEISRAGVRRRRRLARKLQVVFQDPYSSLNPYLTIGQTMCEPLLAATRTPRAQAEKKARELLTRVGLPADAIERYPSQFSGGQRQRIAIARALMLDPDVVICDEAVSALDLSTQAQVLNLLRGLARERSLAYIFIAHDLDVVNYLADRTVVLYRGRVMEQGDAEQVHRHPLHPYTVALHAAAPVTDVRRQQERREARERLAVTERTDDRPATGAAGCPFAARCAFAEDVCFTARPRDSHVDGREVACHLYDSESGHPRAGAGVPRSLMRETA